MARERNFELSAKQVRKMLVDKTRDLIEKVYWDLEERDENLYDLLCTGKNQKYKTLIFDYYPFWASSIEDLKKAKKWAEEDFSKAAKRCLEILPYYDPKPDESEMEKSQAMVPFSLPDERISSKTYTLALSQVITLSSQKMTSLALRNAFLQTSSRAVFAEIRFVID